MADYPCKLIPVFRIKRAFRPGRGEKWRSSHRHFRPLAFRSMDGSWRTDTHKTVLSADFGESARIKSIKHLSLPRKSLPRRIRIQSIPQNPVSQARQVASANACHLAVEEKGPIPGSMRAPCPNKLCWRGPKRSTSNLHQLRLGFQPLARLLRLVVLWPARDIPSPIVLRIITFRERPETQYGHRSCDLLSGWRPGIRRNGLRNNRLAQPFG